jgi:acyl carrier protein
MIVEYKPELNPQCIKMDDSIKHDLGLNSLEMLELIEKIEESFRIEIPLRKIRDLQNVGEIVEFLQRVV